jgi:hypothetical protein
MKYTLNNLAIFFKQHILEKNFLGIIVSFYLRTEIFIFDCHHKVKYMTR